MRRFFRIFKDQRGATAVEYGLILALIFLAMVGAIALVATTTINMWNNVSERGQRRLRPASEKLPRAAEPGSAALFASRARGPTGANSRGGP